MYDLKAFNKFFEDNSNIHPKYYSNVYPTSDGPKELRLSLEHATNFMLNMKSIKPFAEVSGGTIRKGNIITVSGEKPDNTSNLTRSPNNTIHIHMPAGSLSWRDKNEPSGFGGIELREGPSPKDRLLSENSPYFEVVVDPSTIYLYKGNRTYKYDRKTLKQIN